jgi:hypothetical protein
MEGGMVAKHSFTLVVAKPVELTDSLADDLYAAGCEDATPGSSDGVMVVEFHREAASLEEAIRSAIADVRRTGLEIARVEIDAAVVGPAA